MLKNRLWTVRQPTGYLLISRPVSSDKIDNDSDQKYEPNSAATDGRSAEVKSSATEQQKKNYQQ